jgi:hypothetical protein
MWLGDIVQVNVNHGRLNESFDGRISEVDVYIGDEANEETIAATVGRRMGTLLRTLPAGQKKMEQIAKHV